ncbi:lanthionine synthetase C family protein [Nonomuraea sp. NPDC003709]|uniref:lanthionine synthetase C family protein n=1 Tax=Nonomuraea sp. NPDC003709 TaxID=3154450 RepID=UPI0033A9DB4B
MPPTETITGIWPGVGSGPSAVRARELAELVVQRIGTTDDVLRHVARAAGQATYPAGWYPPSLSHGSAGLALLHLESARAGIGEPERAFDAVREAVAATATDPLQSAGLFGGTSGLALAVAECARLEPRFRPSLDRLHDQLARQVLDTQWPRMERHLADEHYDLISGAAGILAYLASIEEPGQEVRRAAGELAGFLIWLSQAADDPGVPHRWLLTPDYYPPMSNHRQQYPHGYLNLGFSHGVPGIAAALAAAWGAGIREPGTRAAIDALTSWIRGTQGQDRFGPVWPEGVAVDERGVELSSHTHCDQLAWCYGTASVSAALLTTARCTGDAELLKVAVEGFETALARTRAAACASPTLCHGHAGILLLCLDFGEVSERAREMVPVLLDELIAYGDPALPLVFVDQERTGVHVDDPSLLTGAIGVALVLLAATGDRRPGWFLPFTAR